MAFEQFTFDPVVMSSGDALTTEQKQVVLYYHYHLKRVSYYRLFEVGQQAGRRDIEASYFNLEASPRPLVPQDVANSVARSRTSSSG